MSKSTHGKPAPIEHQEAAKKLVADEGEQAAARMLGMNRDTLLRVMAGAGVRPGTLALLREYFETGRAAS